MRVFNIGFYTLIRRETLRFLALYQQTILPSIISSGLYIIVFGESLGSRIGEIKNTDYIHFIIPGLVMMSVINHAYQNSSSSIMQAKFLRFIEDILITPLSGFEISMGYVIGATIRGVLNGVLVIIIGWILSGFIVQNWLLTFVYLLSVSWTFASVGVIVGVSASTWDHIGVFTNFIFLPLTFLGGVFYSIDMLPEFWRVLSQFNPLYWMINGLRYSTLGISDTSHNISLLLSISFAILFSIVSTLLISKGYKIKT
jgi:ABC-2 type transport system permease protein